MYQHVQPIHSNVNTRKLLQSRAICAFWSLIGIMNLQPWSKLTVDFRVLSSDKKHAKHHHMFDSGVCEKNAR